MYTASLYAAFASLIHNKHTSLVQTILTIFYVQFALMHLKLSDIVVVDFQSGKRVAMFSYGSGLTATLFSFQIREGHHRFSLSNLATVMNVSGKLKSRHEVSFLCSLSPVG